MKTINLKVWICIACVASSLGAPAQQQAPMVLDIIDMAAISRMTPQQLEALAEGLAAEEIMRTKRSSSSAQALVTSVASKASSGIQSKVGFLGQASAFVASASSKSGGHDEHPGYSYEVHSEKPDFLGLKKSILYTLFQAIKAITGGVTILKGQLIKGGGALAATLGKVISSKGDAVSNLGKKIVSSAALVHKKPHSSKPVYGPPPSSHHVEYVPSTGYGAPTAPAHYSAPSAPTGYAASKYPAHLDGRTKLHAGVVLLAPVGDASAPLETHAPHTGFTLEPSQNILSTVYGAFKSAFPSPAPIHEPHAYEFEHPPPISSYGGMNSYKPTSFAVNSYGEPATAEAYTDYDPRNPYPPYAASKHSSSPKQPILTPDKIKKIKYNLHKVYKALSNDVTVSRSSEELSKFTGLDAYRDMMMKGQLPLFPTPVVSDSDLGVLPADSLPCEPSTTTTTQSPVTTTTQKEQIREKKDLQYFLRGNKIVIQELQG